MQRLNAASWLLVALLARASFAHGVAVHHVHPQDRAGMFRDAILTSAACSNDPNYGEWGFDNVLIQEVPIQEQGSPPVGSTPAQEPKPANPAPVASAPESTPDQATEQAIDPQVIEQAKGGDFVAQYKLGYAYYLGRGIAQDYSQAAIWWKKAAEQGYPDAQNNLGALYNSGRGVPQSYSEAYFWQNLAAARANGPLQAQFAKNRDDSAAKLGVWEKIRVQKRAAKWAAEHPVQPKPAQEPEGNP
jgi:hypothetical protein